MLHINALPDLCLIATFSHLPLHDQMQLALVCHRWKSLQSAVTLKLKSITLLCGNFKEALKSIEMSSFNIPHVEKLSQNSAPLAKISEHNSLMLASFGENVVTRFVHLFANISKLQISIVGGEMVQLNAVARLLRELSPTLVLLKLLIQLKPGQNAVIPRPFVEEVFGAINSLTKLKHLSIDAYNCFSSENDCPQPIDLPILARLDEFNFASGDTNPKGDIIWDSLRKYAEPGQKPARIKYGNGTLLHNTEKLLELNPLFCARFSELLTDSRYDSFDSLFMGPICDRFGSLTCAAFLTDDLTLSQITTHLFRLTQLIYLRLEVNFPSFENNQPLQDIRHYRQLHSVQVLDLDMLVATHDNIDYLNIPYLFPNIQFIELEVLFNDDDLKGCNKCGYHPRWLDQCRRLMLAPLYQCTKLRHLAVCSSPDYEREQIDLVSTRMAVMKIESMKGEADA